MGLPIQITLPILVLFLYSGPREIYKINKLKEKAEREFQRNNFEAAISTYLHLVDSLGVEQDEIAINLAHAYLQIDSLDRAKHYYAQLADSPDKALRSVAFSQMGIISERSQSYPEALSFFRDAIVADPQNQDAGYNYELLKRKMKNQKGENSPSDDGQQLDGEEDSQQDQSDGEDQSQEGQQEDSSSQQQEGDQQQEPSPGEEGQGEESQQEPTSEEPQPDAEQAPQETGEEGEEEDSEEQPVPAPGTESDEDNSDEPPNPQLSEDQLRDRLDEMDISLEKALMILEALNNNEIQYLQQRKRESRSRSDGSPDW